MARIGKRKGDDALILALASGRSVREAAEAAGIGERTAHRRLHGDPSTTFRINETREELFRQAVGKLAKAATAAVETLEKLLTSKSPSVRLGAARAILEYGPRLRDAADFEARLAKLERRAAG